MSQPHPFAQQPPGEPPTPNYPAWPPTPTPPQGPPDIAAPSPLQQQTVWPPQSSAGQPAPQPNWVGQTPTVPPSPAPVEASPDAVLQPPAADVVVEANPPTAPDTPTDAAVSPEPVLDAAAPVVADTINGAAAPMTPPQFDATATAPFATGPAMAYGQPTMPGMPGYPAPGMPYGYGQPPMVSHPYGPGFMPMGQPQPPAPKKSKTALTIVICVVVLAVIAAIIGGYFLLSNKDDPSKPVPAGEAKTPEAAVRGYLQALADGRAADALSFAATAPSNTTYLTDEVLAASNAINPITEITATKDTTSSSQYATVTASYKIGSQSVNTKFYVTQYDKYYKLEDVASRVYLSTMVGGDVDLKLNGVALTSTGLSSTVTLFPGTYQMTVSNSLLTMNNNQFVITDPMSYPDTSGMKLALTSDATGKFQTAVQTAMDKCMSEKALYTSCGFGPRFAMTTSGFIDVDTNSITWSYQSPADGDFSNLTFDYYPYSDAATASAFHSTHIRLDLSDTSGTHYYKTYTLYDINIDFSDTSNITVTYK